MALLSPDERTRYARFRFARDQRDYAAAHALLRTSLSRYADRRARVVAVSRERRAGSRRSSSTTGAAPLVQPVPHARSRGLRHRRRSRGRDRRGVRGPRRQRRRRRAVLLGERERRTFAVCVGAAAGASLHRVLDVEGGVRQGDRQRPLAPSGLDRVRRRRSRCDSCSAAARASTPAAWRFALSAPTGHHCLAVAVKHDRQTVSRIRLMPAVD